MAHHGWVPVLDKQALTPSALKSPFGRLFEAADHSYDSHALSLLAGAMGPMQERGRVLDEQGKSKKEGNPAGFTFLGQFIDHDLTEFRVVGDDFRLIPLNPTIGQRQRVLEDGRPTCTNGRIPTLDLDCVYGLLGSVQPDLFDDKGLFLLDGTDLYRGPQYRNGRLIADPRNDENKLVVQVHMLFQRLHKEIHQAKNGAAKDMAAGGDAFNETRLQVQNAFRRIVPHDYLPRIVQRQHLQAVMRKLQSGKTFYEAMNRRAQKAFNEQVARDEADRGITILALPVEFAHAVFRLGHSQLLPKYQLQKDKKPVDLFGPGADLRGKSPLGNDFIVDWSLFFDAGAVPSAKHGEPLDANLAGPVFRLPPPTIGEPPLSLAERNIRRGIDFGLPSGQEAASHLLEVYGSIPGTPASVLFPDNDFKDVFSEVLEADPSLAWATPLWYYILREAGAYQPAPQLGAVGGLIVAETILGSLATCKKKEFDLAAEFAQKPGDGAPRKPEDIASMRQLLQFLGFFS